LLRQWDGRAVEAQGWISLVDMNRTLY
jgi:hypothetical protein